MESKEDNMPQKLSTHPAWLARHELLGYVGNERGVKAAVKLVACRSILIQAFKDKKLLEQKEVNYHGFSDAETYGIAILRPQCRMKEGMAISLLLIAVRLLDIPESLIETLPRRVLPWQYYMDPTIEFMKTNLGALCPKQPQDDSYKAAPWFFSTMMVVHKKMRSIVEENKDDLRKESRSYNFPYGLIVLMCAMTNMEKRTSKFFFYLYDVKTQCFVLKKTINEVIDRNIELIKDYMHATPKREKKAHYFGIIRKAVSNLFIDRETPERVRNEFVCQNLFHYVDDDFGKLTEAMGSLVASESSTLEPIEEDSLKCND